MKCRLIHSGWCLRSIRHSSGVIRCGSTAGILVPMRTNSTCGICRSRVRIQSSRSSLRASGSPPEMSTSRIAGRAADVVERLLQPGFAAGRFRRGPPRATGCSSGSSSSRSRSPAAARGPDSDGPGPARGCRASSPSGSSASPGAAANSCGRGNHGPPQRLAGVVARNQAHVIGRDAHREHRVALGQGLPLRSESTSTCSSCERVRKRLRACQCQEFQSLSATPGKKARRKARVWGEMRGHRAASPDGEKGSRSGEIRGHRWRPPGRGRQTARPGPFRPPRAPTDRGATSCTVVPGGSSDSSPLQLGGSSSTSK